MSQSFQVRDGSYRARFMPSPDPDTSPGVLDKVANLVFDRDPALAFADIEKVLREFGYEPLPNVQVFVVTIESPREVPVIKAGLVTAIIRDAFAADRKVTVASPTA